MNANRESGGVTSSHPAARYVQVFQNSQFIMRYIYFTLLLCGLFFNKSAAQPSFCGAGYSTFFSANVFFGNDLNPTLDGQILPFGSHIIAVFQESGEWKCAGFVQWNGNNTSMVVNGYDGEMPGYEPNQDYKFIVQLPNGCLIDSITTTYDVSGIYDNPGFFLDGGLSKVASFHAVSRDWLSLDATNGLCAANTASIAAVATGIGAPFTFAWSNGETTGAISNLQNGTYAVTTTDAFGCTATKAASVSSVIAMEIQLVTEQQMGMTTCQSQSSVSEGTSPFSYSWSNGQTSNITSNLPSGNFGLTVTDANGCTAQADGICMLSAVFGIEDLETFFISPNPAQDVAVVNIQLKESQMVSLVVRNSLGQTLKSVSLEGNSFHILLDVEQYASGLYYVEIFIEGKKVTNRLVVNR